MKKLLWAVGGGVAVLSLFVSVSVAFAAFEDVSGSIFDTVSINLKVNGQDGPVSVNAGDRIVVSWISDGAYRCRGNWSRNDIPLTGTIAGKISKSVVIKAACIDKEGNRDDDAVAVNIIGKAQVQQPVTAQPTQTSTQSTQSIKKDRVVEQFRVSSTALLQVFTKEIADFKVQIRSEVDPSAFEREADLLITYIKTSLNKDSVDLNQALVGNKTDIEIDRIDRDISDRVTSLGVEARGRWNFIKQKYSSVANTTQNATSAQPSITSVSPYYGPPGTKIIITGSNFTATGNEVVFEACGGVGANLGGGGQVSVSSVDGKTLSSSIIGLTVESGTLINYPVSCTLKVKNSNGTSNGYGVVITAPATSAQPVTTYTLTTTVTGTGNVTGSGVNCGYGVGSVCTNKINEGTQVTLTASPYTGYVFSRWAGVCSGTGTCSFTMNSDKSVAAVFTPPQSETNATTSSTPTPPQLVPSAPTISGTRTAAGDKLYAGSLSLTATIQNTGGALIDPVSARFQYSSNDANWYDFGANVGPITTVPKNVVYSWEGGAGIFYFRLCIGDGVDNCSGSVKVEIVPTEGAFLGVSREFAGVGVPANDVWSFLKSFFGM